MCSSIRFRYCNAYVIAYHICRASYPGPLIAWCSVHHSFGLMAISVLAIADSTQMPDNGSVTGPLLFVPSSGTRSAVCLHRFER